MALRSSTQELVNTIQSDNQKLNQLVTSTPLSKNIEDCEFYKVLPDEGRSIFYGLDYYRQYRNLTLTKLSAVLTSSEFGFVFLDTPCLVYSEAKMAILYVINIQFRHAHDTILSHTVTDRNEKIPTWIISLRQQLPFLEILPMSKPRSYYKDSVPEFSSKPQGPAFSIYIDFRRVIPPNWVREIKVSHLLDNVTNVQKLILDDPFNQQKVEEYERDIEDLQVYIKKYEQDIHKQTARHQVFKTTTADIIQSAVSPKQMFANQGKVEAHQVKQTKIEDMFLNMKPVKRAASEELMPEEPRAKKQKIEDQSHPFAKSSVPVSNSVVSRPPPRTTKATTKIDKQVEDLMEIDNEKPKRKYVKTKKPAPDMDKFVVPVTQEETIKKLVGPKPIQFTLPEVLTQEETNIVNSFKRWYPEDKTHISILLKLYLSSTGFYENAKPNIALPFIRGYLAYLKDRMDQCQSAQCIVFNSSTKQFIQAMYECSQVATDKTFLTASMPILEPTLCFLSGKLLQSDDIMQVKLHNITKGISTPYIINKSKHSFIKVIVNACQFLYTSFGEYKKKPQDEIVVRQVEVLGLSVKLMNSW